MLCRRFFQQGSTFAHDSCSEVSSGVASRLLSSISLPARLTLSSNIYSPLGHLYDTRLALPYRAQPSFWRISVVFCRTSACTWANRSSRSSLYIRSSTLQFSHRSPYYRLHPKPFFITLIRVRLKELINVSIILTLSHPLI